MRIIGPGKRLRIYIGESDHWQGKALYMALLETLKKEGLAGATVTRGVAGFGAHSRIHTAALESLSADLPLVVEVVDRSDQIDRAISVIGPMVREGLITIEDVEIAKYTHRDLEPIPGDRPVSKVMTPDVVSVRAETPLVEVIDLLIGKMFKAVPVVDEQRHVIGLISDGDLLTRGGLQQRMSVTERLDSETLASQLDELRQGGKTARDVMTSPVLKVRQDMALAHAVSLMVERTLKRLPVVDANERLVGMLSRVDVLRTVEASQLANHGGAASRAIGQTVGEVMEPVVPTVPLDAELADIADQMAHAALKRVIVVDAHGKAVGIINDGDLVARVEQRLRPGLLQTLARRGRTDELPAITAAQMMTATVLSGPPGTPVTQAIQRMLAEQRKRFVVVDEASRPIGIVDRQMLLHAVAGKS